MKTLLLTLLISIGSFAQKESYQYFSVGSDTKFLGKDLIFNAGCVGKDFEMFIGYEVFKKINFDKYTAGAGYHFPRYVKNVKVDIVPSIDFNIINRWSDWGGGLGDRNQKSSHIAFGGNLAFRIEITDRIMIENQFQFLPRVDLNTMYGGRTVRISNFSKIIIKL